MILFVQTSSLTLTFYFHFVHIFSQLICIKRKSRPMYKQLTEAIIKLLSSLYGNCVFCIPFFHLCRIYCLGHSFRGFLLVFRMITNINLRLILLHNWIKKRNHAVVALKNIRLSLISISKLVWCRVSMVSRK